MPLFNETLESIAQAIVTLKRALKEGVIEEENYKELNDYLAMRAKDFKIKKSHITRANKNLNEELETEVQDFFMDEGEALCNMAEELLEEHERDDVPYNWGMPAKTVTKTVKTVTNTAVARAAIDDNACKMWANMNDKERDAIAVLASMWQNR
jgi:hypothetical protein